MSTMAEAATAVDVLARREGRWWVFEIPSLDVTGQAADLSSVADEARGIIAAWDTDGPREEDIRVRVRLDGESEARRIWEEGEADEAEARKVLERSAASKREAVALLRHEKGYSAAQAAQVLGVSRQRIYQLGASA